MNAGKQKLVMTLMITLLTTSLFGAACSKRASRAKKPVISLTDIQKLGLKSEAELQKELGDEISSLNDTLQSMPDQINDSGADYNNLSGDEQSALKEELEALDAKLEETEAKMKEVTNRIQALDKKKGKPAIERGNQSASASAGGDNDTQSVDGGEAEQN